MARVPEERVGGAGLTRVGVIGLGRMGLAMARHLIAAGFEVSGCDIDQERRAALVQSGGRESSSPRAVAEASDAIVVMVADDAQLSEVVLGRDGVLLGARAGLALIISSTVKPATCRAIAEAARPGGVGVLDAPVCRGQRAAEAGTLTVLVGGYPELFERCRPIFAAFGTHVFHLGNQVGAGQVGKMVNNLLLWTGAAGVYAYLSLGRRLGVPAGLLRAALQESSGDSYALRELDRMTLAWSEKDLAAAAEVANEMGLSLPLIGEVRALLRELTPDHLRRLCRDADGDAPDQDPAEAG